MSRTRTRLVLAAGVVAAGALWSVTPAAHAASGNTTVTFQIASSGTLSISVPTSASIGSLTMQPVTSNYTGSGTLGSTTVTDSRGGIAVTDTVTATATTFGGTLSGNSGIGAADASLSSGLVTFSGGMVAATGALSGTNLSGTGQQVMIGVNTGTGSATYNPTLSLTVPPANAIADTYTGTVTQTVQ